MQTLKNAPVRFRVLVIVIVSIVVIALAVHMWWRVSLALPTPPFLPHDDLLFFDQARSILRGEWLGPWDDRTLLKGGAWPIAMAIEMALHLPVFTTITVLTVLDCALWVAAAAIVSRRLILSALLGCAFLLLSPVFFSQVGLRLLREAFYGQLSVTLVLSLVLLVAVLLARPSRRVAIVAAIASAVVGGVAFAAAWLTREERQWQVAVVIVVLLGGALAVVVRRRHVDPRSSLRAIAVVAVLTVAGGVVVSTGLVLAYSLKNDRVYGALASNDMVDGEFPRAYSLLKSIDPGTAGFPRGVPLSEAQRDQAYDASPAFAELEADLESAKNGWRPHGCIAMNVCGDYAGGWVTFALRDAAMNYAGATNEIAFQSYWKKVADELQSACDTGKLSCTVSTGLVPPLESVDWNDFARSVGVELAAVGTGTPSLLSAGTVPAGAPEIVREWNAAYGDPAANPIGLTRFPGMTVLVIGYQVLAGLGIASFIVLAVRRKVATPLVRVALLSVLAVFVAIVGRTLILALANVTSFPAVGILYSVPSQALWSLAACVSWTVVAATVAYRWGVARSALTLEQPR